MRLNNVTLAVGDVESSARFSWTSLVAEQPQGKLAKTQLTLGLTGLRDLFPPDAMFSAQSVARPKPDPALFQYAAAAMNATPSACAVIEDTASGVTAAVAAGMRAIGYAADSDEHALKNAGAEIAHSLQLLQLLGIP
jgi:beta-phosphoglucomutase-like phosphatase (HAD superfamily)